MHRKTDGGWMSGDARRAVEKARALTSKARERATQNGNEGLGFSRSHHRTAAKRENPQHLQEHLNSDL